MNSDSLFIAEINEEKYYGIHDKNDKYGFLKKAEEEHAKTHPGEFVSYKALKEIGSAREIK